MPLIEISYKKIEAYARRIEKKNFKKHGRSPSWVSMLRAVMIDTSYFNSDIVLVTSVWKVSLDKFNLG